LKPLLSYLLALLCQTQQIGPANMLGPSAMGNPGACTPGQTTLDTDNFTGTAGTALHTYNANWDNASYNVQCADGAIATGSNGASGSFTACDGRTGQTWTNNQFAQATLVVAAVADAAYIGVRITSVATRPDGYYFGVDPGSYNGNYRIIKWTGGVKAVIHASSIAAVNGDVLNFQIIGSTFQVKINGTVKAEFSVTDSTYTTGVPGILISNTSGVKTWSTWTAGSAC